MSKSNSWMRGIYASALILSALAVVPCAALGQPDLRMFGERMVGEDLYGIGGSVIVPLRGYRFDIAAGGSYFFAPSDTSSAWTVDLDANLNLSTFRFLRPYAGVGLNYFNRDGDRVGLNLRCGAYIRFADWLVPFIQYTYRTIPSIDHSYIQIGARVLLRRQ